MATRSEDALNPLVQRVFLFEEVDVDRSGVRNTRKHVDNVSWCECECAVSKKIPRCHQMGNGASAVRTKLIVRGSNVALSLHRSSISKPSPQALEDWEE
jgi:hypothetical protein